MTENIENRIKTLISKELGLPESKLKNDQKFIQDLGWDSMELVSMLMMIEDNFNFQIADSDAEKIKTLQDLIDYTQRHQPH